MVEMTALLAQTKAHIANWMHHIRQKIASFLIHLIGWWNQIRVWAHLSLKAFSNFGIILISGILSYLLLSPPAQKAINEFQDYYSIFLAGGSLIGTILVLAFSLAILPIQRAAETLTPSAARLYREDQTTQFVFITLGAFCLLSFFLTLDKPFGEYRSWLMPFQVLMLGCSLDLLRWHNRRMAKLIDPTEAVTRLTKGTNKLIRATQRNVSRAARIAWRSLTSLERAEQSLETLEAVIYRGLPDPHRWSVFLSEISEIGARATVRSETFLARNSINALAVIGCTYLELRAKNLNFYPAALGVTRSDASDVFNILSEALIDINRNAVNKKLELVSVAVVKAFGAIANRVIPIQIPGRAGTVGDLAWHVLGYMQLASEEALRQSLDNVGLESGTLYLDLVRYAPEDVPSHNLHSHVISGLFKMTTIFLASGKGALANTLGSQLLLVCHLAIERKHYEAREILRDTLSKVEQLVPLALAVEKTRGATLLDAPFAAPYETTNQHSLAYLLERAARQVQTDERHWVNPYHSLIELNKVIWRHFRTIAENNDLTASPILWHLLHTLKAIAKVHLSLIQEPLTDNENHISELVKDIGWYISFTWAAFQQFTAPSQQYAEETCSTLGVIGLWFLDNGHVQIAESAASDIAAVTASICKAKKFSSQYDIADLLMPIWHLKILAERQGRGALAQKLDTKMGKPESISAEVWTVVQEALTTRKHQLENELQEVDEWYRRLERPTDILKSILNRPAQDNPEGSPT